MREMHSGQLRSTVRHRLPLSKIGGAIQCSAPAPELGWRAGATAGGMGKMSDEPLAREREPIERMRARLEALAAPTTGAAPRRRSETSAPAALPPRPQSTEIGPSNRSVNRRTPAGSRRTIMAKAVELDLVNPATPDGGLSAGEGRQGDR